MMQMPPTPIRCAGKTQHLTHKAAAKELKVANARKMTVYKCEHCRSYHVGHDNSKGRKGDRK